MKRERGEAASRKEAKQLNVTRYFTGRRCAHGHIDYRSVSSGECFECRRMRTRAWWKEHKAEARAASKRWKDNNKGAVRAHDKKWKAENPEKVSSCFSDWRKRNMEAWRENVRKARRAYRARKRANGGYATSDEVEGIIVRQRGKCAVCGNPLKYGVHIDHVVPVSRGGTSDPANLQALCPKCNLSKGAKDSAEFMRERGYLL